MYEHAIIVLGCGVDATGNFGDDPKGSVKLAISELNNSSAKTCLIMSGFVSYKADFKPSISEAQAMKDYAVSLGVASEKIFTEAESKDSLGNLLFTKVNLLEPLGIKSVSIVRGPNQTTERIQYLATKVLGSDYAIKIIAPNIERPEERKREEKSLAEAKQNLDPIADGDTNSIYKLMREKHPGYSGQSI